MNIKKSGKDLIVNDIKDFDLAQTMECGQCFHFVRLDEEEYELTAYGRYLHIKQEKNILTFFDTTKKDFENIWRHYFDLDTDYGKIKRYITKRSPELKEIIKKNKGIRILNQEFFETLMSFIISQNNRIPRIKALVAAISEKWGRKLTDTMYAFPDASGLSKVCEDDFRELKTGFRAAYLCDAVKNVLSKDIDEHLLTSADLKNCEEKLCAIKGIGPKVANCIMLFSLGKRKAFPIDVWMKRIMEELYFGGKEQSLNTIAALAADRFGEYGGYAQQYLFAYAREAGESENKG